MSAELALTTGLGIIVYLAVKLSKELEDAETEINQAIFTLSLLMLIGLEYTAYGIADSQNFGNAKTAYLAALLVTCIAFIGFLGRFIKTLIDKAESDDVLEGL